MAETTPAEEAAIVPSIFTARSRGDSRTFAGFEQNLRTFVLTGLRSLNPDDAESFFGLARMLTGLFLVDISQKQLAMRLRVTPMTIQRWAKGISLPSPGPRAHFYADMVRILAEALENGAQASNAPTTATISAIGERVIQPQFDQSIATILDDACGHESAPSRRKRRR